MSNKKDPKINFSDIKSGHCGYEPGGEYFAGVKLKDGSEHNFRGDEAKRIISPFIARLAGKEFGRTEIEIIDKTDRSISELR